MADSGESAGSSWWSSWIDKAKETSASAFSVVKRDLSEFVKTVTSDTSEAISTTKDAIRDSLQTGETKEGVDGEEKRWIKSTGSTSSGLMLETISMSRSEAELNSLKNEIGTYCNEPEDEIEFCAWSSTFNIESSTKEISELLVSNDRVRAFQTKLVPNAVSYKTFWTRYFYRVYRWKKEQEHRARLIERADQNEEKELAWEDEDDGVGKGVEASGSVSPVEEKNSRAETPVSTSSESFVTLPLPGNNGNGSEDGRRSSEEPAIGEKSREIDLEKEVECSTDDWESWDM